MLLEEEQGLLHFQSGSFASGGESDADGRLELVLQRPGQWTGVAWVSLNRDDPFDPDRNDARRFELTVPDADEHSFELDVDTLTRVRSRDELEPR